MKTILITGCSSGFGLETARLFLERGWTVVATMRSLREGLLPVSDRLKLLPLDVTDAASIARAVTDAGPIDALVNNAGVGWFNALEGTPMDIVRQTFETNTFGTMALTQAVLPQFRQRRAGVVVNVTSSVTLAVVPLLSVYTASKAAVDAFTAVLAEELKPFGVHVALVLPGRAPDTRFGDNVRARLSKTSGIPEAYAELANQVFAHWAVEGEPVTEAADVAEAVWRAVNEPDAPLRIPAGADAVALMGTA